MSTQVLVWRRLETQFLESWSCSWSRSWSCSLKSWWSQSWNLKSWSWTVESWLHHWVDSELRRCYLVAATMSVTVSVTVTVQFNSCHCASTIRLDEALKQCTAASCIASLTAYITVWCLISAFLHLCPSCVEKASYVSSVIGQTLKRWAGFELHAQSQFTVAHIQAPIGLCLRVFCFTSKANNVPTSAAFKVVLFAIAKH